MEEVERNIIIKNRRLLLLKKALCMRSSDNTEGSPSVKTRKRVAEANILATFILMIRIIWSHFVKTVQK